MCSIKPEIVVNDPAKSQEDSTESLNADQFVDNGVTLSHTKPHPEEVGIHQNIDKGIIKVTGLEKWHTCLPNLI